MNRIRIGVSFAILATALAFCASARAQQWSGILSASRAIDWSGKGVAGGVPNRQTICASLTSTATASQINNAIGSCPSGGVVFLAAGTYNLSGGIAWTGKSGVTLRGAGADQTLLVFSDDNGCHGFGADICIDSSDTNWVGGPSNSANWTAGYSKGASTITLSSVSGLKVGYPLILDQADDSSDTGTKFVCQSTSSPACSLEGNGNNGARQNRDQAQIVQVTGCGATTLGAACTSNSVNIKPGLYADNWSSAKSPGAWWADGPVSGNGVEDLSVDNTSSGGARGIEIFNCIDCWVTGTRGIKSGRSHVEITNSARVTIRDNYFYGTQNAVSQSYGVSPYGSTDVLVENNIFHFVTTPLQINGCTGCVLSYNFAVNNYYTVSAGYVMPMVMMHTAGDELILVEGNVGDQTQADVFHGTHNLITYFRNYFSGTQPACYNGSGGFASCLYHRVPVELLSYNRLFNVIGNVLGTPGVHTGYQSGASIFDLNSGNSEGSVTVPDDSLVGTTLMRWGNWDTVTNNVRWCGNSSNTGWSSTCGGTSEVPTGLSKYANPVPASESLPASFYLNAKPSWWPAGKAWPAIGPDVTGGTISGTAGHAYTSPAQDCYLNTMRGPSDGTGAVLKFNASQCYGGGSAGTPLVPPVLNNALIQ